MKIINKIFYFFCPKSPNSTVHFVLTTWLQLTWTWTNPCQALSSHPWLGATVLDSIELNNNPRGESNQRAESLRLVFWVAHEAKCHCFSGIGCLQILRHQSWEVCIQTVRNGLCKIPASQRSINRCGCTPLKLGKIFLFAIQTSLQSSTDENKRRLLLHQPHWSLVRMAWWLII